MGIVLVDLILGRMEIDVSTADAETKSIRLGIDSETFSCERLNSASGLLCVTKVAKGSISSIRDRTALSTSRAYLVPRPRHANGVAHEPRGFLHVILLRGGSDYQDGRLVVQHPRLHREDICIIERGV